MIRGLLGLFLGILLGFSLGWWFRPPSSFPLEELKQAIEAKFGSATEVAREQLADFAEDLARRLRKSGEIEEEPTPTPEKPSPSPEWEPSDDEEIHP